jgi:hypothetical protein
MLGQTTVTINVYIDVDGGTIIYYIQPYLNAIGIEI